ncbi:ATP-binding protein [Candidatus Omnitrophota bacterium]
MGKNYIDLAPSPAPLIEALRDIGYSIETAIADLIDNSITAKACKIDIKFGWDEGDPWLAIVDDGGGMSQKELFNAMRFGSMHPLSTRSPDDLGRFGLGMKTASFSQCRHFTVLTKKDNKVSCCEWDLDLMSEEGNTAWRLGILDIVSVNNKTVLSSIFQEYIKGVKSGTIVLWGKIDRFEEPGPLKIREKNFNALMNDARKHLELVFHRFISPETVKKKLIISMNNNELSEFNPFNPHFLATQELPEQQIFVEGEKIIVQPYILPHHNKVPSAEYEKYGGEAGYLHNQGFYVYRNKRLIIKGTWFRLIKKEELNKLIRIKVDIPNTLDHLWKIDVKKSHALPPEIVKKELLLVINRIEGAGRRVYRQRGARLSSKKMSPAWNRKAEDGTIVYRINRDHPYIKDFVSKLDSKNRDIFQNVLSTLEASFPVDLFYSDVAARPEEVESPSINEKVLEEMMDLFISTWRKGGVSEKALPEKILGTDPFAAYPDIVKSILSRKGFNDER